MVIETRDGVIAMEYTIVALTNDKARLVVSTTRTNDETIKSFAIANYEARGYVVIVSQES